MKIKEFFNDYKKMVKVFGIISIVLIIIPIVGYIINLFLEFLLIYGALVLALFGYVGGIWLWSILNSSEKIREMSKIIKIIGPFGLIGLIIMLISGIFLYFQPESMLRDLLPYQNYILLFIVAYLLGYDYSILVKHNIIPQKNGTEENTNISEPKNLFEIDWNIVKVISSVMLVLILLFFIPLLCIGIYGNLQVVYGNVLAEMMELFLKIFIFIVGFGLAFIVWEHIKKSGLLDENNNFKNILIILSIITTVIALFLLGFGYYTLKYGTIFELRLIIIIIALFIECMTFYFLGLIVATK